MDVICFTPRPPYLRQVVSVFMDRMLGGLYSQSGRFKEQIIFLSLSEIDPRSLDLYPHLVRWLRTDLWYVSPPPFPWTQPAKWHDNFRTWRYGHGNPKCNTLSSGAFRVECLRLFTLAGSNKGLGILAASCRNSFNTSPANEQANCSLLDAS
jgi:hypothetical protein